MLSQRLLTAVILIAVFLWINFSVATAVFGLLLALIVVAAAWEWCGLIQLQSHRARVAYLLSFILLMPLAYQLLAAPKLLLVVLSLTAIMWLALLILLGYINHAQINISTARCPQWLLVPLGIMLLLPAWLTLLMLHERPVDGPWLVLFLMLLIWGADSGAYFTGRAWGKNKLAPLISPGKSWEGVAGGALLVLLLAVGTALYWQQGWPAWLLFVLLSMVTMVFSVVGDLLESLVKRLAGVKDSGHFVPGHGGVLDRIDSLTAAAPIFTLGMMLLGKQT